VPSANVATTLFGRSDSRVPVTTPCSTIRWRDRLVTLVGHRGRNLDERLVALAPAEQLGGMDLVEALAARHAVVDLDEERYAHDQRATHTALVPRLK
jgi:hypothetical protein